MMPVLALLHTRTLLLYCLVGPPMTVLAWLCLVEPPMRGDTWCPPRSAAGMCALAQLGWVRASRYTEASASARERSQAM